MEKFQMEFSKAEVYQLKLIIERRLKDFYPYSSDSPAMAARRLKEKFQLKWNEIK